MAKYEPMSTRTTITAALVRDGPMTTKEIVKVTGLTLRQVRDSIWTFRSCDNCNLYIKEYVREFGRAEKCWAVGNGRDAVYPRRLTRIEIAKNYRVRHRAQIQAKEQRNKKHPTPVWLNGLL